MNNDETGDDAKQLFKVKYFFKIIDCAIISIESRFEQQKYYNDIFCLLYNVSDLKNKSNDDLKNL